LIDPPWIPVRQSGATEISFEDLPTKMRLGLDLTKEVAKITEGWKRTSELMRKASISPLYSPPTSEDIRAYRQEVALLYPLGFWAKNVSETTAQDVRVKISGAMQDGLQIVDEGNHPANQHDILAHALSDVMVEEHGDNWTVSVKIGKLQPQEETFTSGFLYLGSTEPVQIEMKARIFADNVPCPIEIPLTVNIKVEEKIYREGEWEEKDNH